MLPKFCNTDQMDLDSCSPHEMFGGDGHFLILIFLISTWPDEMLSGEEVFFLFSQLNYQLGLAEKVTFPPVERGGESHSSSSSFQPKCQVGLVGSLHFWERGVNPTST